MLFRKKSKTTAVPAPTVVPIDVSGEPDLRGLGRVLWAKKTKILGITLLAAATAFAVVNAMTPRYRSESRLLLETRENVFLRAEADKNSGDRTAIDPEAVTSQVQLVLSRDLAREVIKKEKLADNPEFDSALGGPSVLKVVLSLFGIVRDPAAMTKEERTLESYYDRLSVYAVEKSRVIVVDFLSANPDLAARVANTIAETYLKMQQTSKQDQTRAAGDWLAGEIANLRTKVADAEAKVEAYRTKSNLYVGSNNSSLPNQQLTEINSQISAARGQKADLEARARQLRELIRSGKPIESSDIANSESMRRLIEQRNALRSPSRPSSTMTPGSPATGWRRSPPASTRSRSKPRRPMSRTCNCARSNGRPRPSAICSNPISPNIARRPRATTSMPRRRRRASFRVPARRSSRTIRRNCRPC